MQPAPAHSGVGAQSAALPQLRGELRLMKGAPDAVGNATWLVHDPLRNRYFQIGRSAFEILSHWQSGTPDGIAASVEAAGGRAPELADIEDVARFLRHNLLVEVAETDGHKVLLDRARHGDHGWLAWAVHNYLFVRIPLVRPQAFLERTLPLVAPLFCRTGLGAIGLLTLVGLYLVSRQWDAFVGTFLHFFSLQGLVVYGITLCVLKVAHELGHAYMATRFGVRVGSMGLAFLVMMPVLYTDVTGAWQLTSRRQRMLISAAGVMVELAIAGLATFLWAFLPEGPARSAAFFLATTSWLMTLAINLNPLVRFDGYYLLADALNAPNLQARAFAMGRWWLRETLFGLGEDAPEICTTTRARGLIVYALVVWATRLVTFVGIAVVVYLTFFKLLGLILFAIEIVWFIAKPIWSELRAWWDRKDAIMGSRHARLTLAGAGLAALWAVLPAQSTVSVPAVLRASEEARLFAPRPARIEKIHVKTGDMVRAGDLLFELSAPDLELETGLVGQRIALLRLRLDRRLGDKLERTDSLVLEQELQREVSKAAGLAQEMDRLKVRTSVAGRVSDLDPNLHPGRWTDLKQPLGIVSATDRAAVTGYVEEMDIGRIGRGVQGRFIPDDPTQPSRAVSVTEIARTAAEAIDIPYLVSLHDGAIAVEPDASRKLRPRQGQYLIDMASETVAPAMVSRGVVQLRGESESVALRHLRQAAQILIRESGF